MTPRRIVGNATGRTLCTSDRAVTSSSSQPGSRCFAELTRWIWASERSLPTLRAARCQACAPLMRARPVSDSSPVTVDDA
jgi:hypothetical protein